jgi:hypothetical protein
MTITLEIKPEVQAELARQAVASGKPLEAHAATLLEQALHLPLADQNLGFGKNLVEVCALAAELTGGAVFSREVSTWRPLDLS